MSPQDSSDATNGILKRGSRKPLDFVKGHRKDVRRWETEGPFYDTMGIQIYKELYSHFIMG
jgi:hypothetical protein